MLRQLASPVLMDYLRNADRTAGMVTSVCTGSLLLAGAGLPAYHRFLERLGAIYVPQRWVEDGHYLIAAGVSGGSIPLCDSRPKPTVAFFRGAGPSPPGRGRRTTARERWYGRSLLASVPALCRCLTRQLPAAGLLIEPLVQLPLDLFARHQLQQRLTQDLGYHGRPCL
jgi:hypothetical protein